MVIAQEYDFITNGSKLAQALKGIYTTYQKIGNQTRAEGNEARAKEYHKLALSYQDMYQTIKKADYDVKLYTTANTKPRTYAMPNVPNTKRNTTAEPAAEIKRNNSTTPNRKTEDKTSVLAEAEGVARKQLSTDSLLIAQKDAQIITLSEKNKQKEQQYEQLNTEKEQHEEEARKYRFIWIASSIASIMILLGTLFYALYLQKNQKQVITQQKEKIVAHNEKVNRQIILLREQEAAVLKKEAELAVAYAKIDDAKLEGNSLHYLLQEDVYYPLVSLLMKAYQEEISKDLMYQSGKQILNTLYTLLEVQNFAYTSIQLQNQPLAPIFQKSVEQANELLKGRKIEVLNLIPASLSANFDTVMLERVFYNFIQNSLEYVPEGGKISVDAFEKNGWIVINYQDNGPSVSAKHLHLVFSKFAPEEARPSALGLPYVKVAIEKQGGVIEVTSPYPNCLRFTFSLPQV
jgi:K+-sensing histidine kinase KdpD